MKKLVLALFAATALSSAHANIVSNGDFEDSNLGAGWTIDSGIVGVAPVSAYINCCGVDGLSYPNGRNAAFFGWGDMRGGSLWQDLDTVAGTSYTLNFAYGAIAQGNVQTMSVQLLNGGSVLANQDVHAYGSFDQAHMVAPFSMQFTASSSVTRLMFSDTSAWTYSTDGVLDNVSVSANVSAVPEADTYAMLVAGLGLVGVFARRKAAK